MGTFKSDSEIKIPRRPLGLGGIAQHPDGRDPSLWELHYFGTCWIFQCQTNGLEQEKVKDHNPYIFLQSSNWKGSQKLWQSCRATGCTEMAWLPTLPGLYPKDYNCI